MTLYMRHVGRKVDNLEGLECRFQIDHLVELTWHFPLFTTTSCLSSLSLFSAIPRDVSISRCVLRYPRYVSSTIALEIISRLQVIHVTGQAMLHRLSSLPMTASDHVD